MKKTKNIRRIVPKLFSRREFDDEEKNRVGKTLFTVLTVFLCGAAIILAVAIATGSPNVAIAAALNIGFFMLALIIARGGWLQISATMVFLCIIASVTWLSSSNDGIRDTATFVYPVVIITASLMLNSRLFIAVTAATFVSAGVVVYVELTALITTPFFHPTSVAELIQIGVILAVTAITARMLAESLKKSLKGARENEKRLADTNKRLEEYATELESYRNHLQALVEERTRELEITQKQLVLKERMAILGELTNVVSHELRNPLSTIRSSLFAISENLPAKPQKRLDRALQRADRNVIRCVRIIDELLEYTRVREPEMVFLTLEECFEPILQGYDVPEGMVLNLNLTDSQKVSVDRELFRRSATNVMDNGFEAMSASGKDLTNRLTVSSRVSERRVEITFSDSGTGIPAEDLERIFEPLYTTRPLGVGLGLTIARRNMEIQQGGAYASNHSDGAAIVLWLPEADG